MPGPLPAFLENYPDITLLLSELLAGMQEILKERLIGVYLEGSLANGGFDTASDVDFLSVTSEPVDENTFRALYALHERLASFPTPWAVELEGSYLPLRFLQRFDPEQRFHPNLERGREERLKIADHDEGWWTIHRHILYHRGIGLYGPEPHTLFTPPAPEDLKHAMRVVLAEWAQGLVENPQKMNSRGYQSYVVLSLCRILYTLTHGEVVPKPHAMHWALTTLDPRWHGLIQSAWEGRMNPRGTPAADELYKTVAFIREVMARAGMM
jgi:hypothetical protein